MRASKAWLLAFSLFAGGWFTWPFLVPMLSPASGPPWFVVLDGYHRLDAALDLQRQPRMLAWPILLITCPTTSQPSSQQRQNAVGVLETILDGTDTADQAAVLSRYLRLFPTKERPRSIWLISDSHHFPRAAWAFQTAVGGLGIFVQAHPVDAMKKTRHLSGFWLALRDFARIQFWRWSSSTGAFMRPNHAQNKYEDCWGSQKNSPSSIASLI